MGAACQCALHEQLDCRKPLNSCRSEPWGVRWTRKRIQSVNVLALNPESLAARGQNVDLWCCLDDVRRYRGSIEFACSLKMQVDLGLHRPNEPTSPAWRRQPLLRALDRLAFQDRRRGQNPRKPPPSDAQRLPLLSSCHAAGA